MNQLLHGLILKSPKHDAERRLLYMKLMCTHFFSHKYRSSTTFLDWAQTDLVVWLTSIAILTTPCPDLGPVQVVQRYTGLILKDQDDNYRLKQSLQ